ncbi:hypothetical protein DFJ58DRAFT_796398, partial [Suillus subalutaceus]|uniref:uncharacterized protein n=1 Tax=Suillus subalutaceus TaxID=48586 RepID=UPI001B862C27
MRASSPFSALITLADALSNNLGAVTAIFSYRLLLPRHCWNSEYMLLIGSGSGKWTSNTLYLRICPWSTASVHSLSLPESPRQVDVD